MHTAMYMIVVIGAVASVVSYFIGFSKGYHEKAERVSNRNGRGNKANRQRKALADVTFVDERGREIKSVVKMPKKVRKSRWNKGKANAKQKNFQRRPVKW